MTRDKTKPRYAKDSVGQRLRDIKAAEVLDRIGAVMKRNNLANNKKPSARDELAGWR